MRYRIPHLSGFAACERARYRTDLLQYAQPVHLQPGPDNLGVANLVAHVARLRYLDVAGRQAGKAAAMKAPPPVRAIGEARKPLGMDF